MRPTIGLLAALFLAASIHAQQPFWAALSGRDIFGCFILPISSAQVQWIVPNVVQSENGVFMIASGDGHRVLGLRFGAGTRIVEVEPDGTQTPFFEDLTLNAGSLAVGPDGRVFVTLFSAGSFLLGIISPSGVLEATHPLPVTHFPESIAVANDGCTLFYVDEGTNVRRINGCTGAVLSDFVATAFISDVDPLPNGQVLVAANGTVALYDASGTFIRNVARLSSYGLSGQVFLGQVAASDDLSTVWLTASGCDTEGILLRVAFGSGTELSRRDIMNFPNALILGPMAGIPAGIPTSSAHALLLLVIGIAAVAVSRL